MSPSPPSSFTPPRETRVPGPSPPPSPSPARVKGKGKGRALTFDAELNYGNRSPSKSPAKKSQPSTSRSSSVTRVDSKPNGQAAAGKGGTAANGAVREEKLKGDAGFALDTDDEENGWGWEEEHTWGEVSHTHAQIY